MEYPFWDVDIGYGWLMGSVAVFHVFISHFAIGGGLYLVLAEMSARKLGNTYRLDFLQRLSKFFVMASVVMGALTGVGIWFIIGLINPAATEVLIHHYVWAWAIEWTFFAVEICAAIIYFYGWKRMSARNHVIVGWIYFVSAWFSLVVINGIVTSMLTPGEWLQTGDVWDGLLNPTYWSSLWFRTGICIMLAGLYALFIASFAKPDSDKASLVRYNSIWTIAGFAIMIPTWLWYFDAIPESIRVAAVERMPEVGARISEGAWIGAAAILIVIIFGYLMAKRFHPVVAVVLMLLGFGLFGEYEWMRESIRKPYVLQGYMYGNAVALADAPKYQAEGYLPSIEYRTGDDGADLFRHLCRSCHTLDGYRPLTPKFDGTDEQFIAAMVRGTGVMRGNMPPYWGTVYESELIASHIYDNTDRRKLGEIYSLSGVELGRIVYEIRCGSCHELGGFNDKSESLVGLEDEDYHDLLDLAGDLGEEMPEFTADDQERAALIEFLKTLTEGGTQ